jgi:PBSX family phage terminase large subunit
VIDLRSLPLSEKQIDYFVDSDAFVNLAEGSIRAGKTISGLLRWLTYIAQDAPKTGDLVVCAKTFDTAVRNIFNPLRDPSIFGNLAKATTYTRGAPTATILGESVNVITFNDERAEARLRGGTFRGTYVDEWSLMPRTFHEQLLGRHSVDGSQIFGNTNPDNPRHWLKEYIDRARPGGDLSSDWKVWHFTLDDNPGLSEAKKAQYRRQYKGLYYRRNILGEWCVAEGTVYEGWDPAKHVVKTLPGITRWISLGVDYGTVNPFAGLLLGVGVDGKLYLAREWRWDSKKQQRSLTDAEYSARLRAWLDKLGIRPDWICVDPSAASFSTQLFRDGMLPTNADNDVLDGIRLVASLLAEGLLFVHESCEGWIEEIPGYVWDEKAALLGEDKPVKAGDHSLDAGRYAIKTPEVLWRPLLRSAHALAA